MKNLFKICFAVLFTVAFFQTAQAQFIKFDGVEGESNSAAYIKIGDIKGEATDKNHRGWIDVLSLRLGDANLDGEVNGKKFPGDLFIITKEKDRATSTIQKYFNARKGLEQVEFEYFNRESREKLHLNMFGAKINGWKVEEGESVMTEKITLGYTEVEWTYMKNGVKMQGDSMEKLRYLMNSK